ncbi:MAG TPA: hypothetical protein PKE04_20315, partial [Clostridia bacterium]|nr:hypothetical protein [Clostridia bacterium]
MKRNGTPRRLRALAALLALASLAAAGLIAWERLRPAEIAPQTEAGETADGGIPMREDLLPNADAYYRTWDLHL